MVCFHHIGGAGVGDGDDDGGGRVLLGVRTTVADGVGERVAGGRVLAGEVVDRGGAAVRVDDAGGVVGAMASAMGTAGSGLPVQAVTTKVAPTTSHRYRWPVVDDVK